MFLWLKIIIRIQNNKEKEWKIIVNLPLIRAEVLEKMLLKCRLC
jgi:hypothetical protein